MAIFTDADLAGYGQVIQDLVMSDTCDVLRATSTQDTQGGKTGVTWPILSTVPCVLVNVQRAPKELVDDTQLVSAVIKIAMLPRHTDVKTQDRLRIAGVVHRVIAPLDPVTYEVVRRVYVVLDELEEVS